MQHAGMSPGAPIELPVEALAALQGGNKIEAIKVVRAAHRLDLKDAKDLVDRYVAAQPGLQQRMNAAGAEQGRKLVFAIVVAIAMGAASVLLSARRLRRAAVRFGTATRVATDLPVQSFPGPRAVHRGDISMRTLIVLFALAFCACGDGGHQPPPTQGRIYDTQRQALDKAKAVNDTVMDAAQRQRSEEESQAK